MWRLETTGSKDIDAVSSMPSRPKHELELRVHVGIDANVCSHRPLGLR